MHAVRGGRGGALFALVASLVVLAQSVSAHPFGGLPGSERAGPSSLTRVHGFHCRRELGWNPRTGLYEYHRHEGICANYKGCVREMYRCNLLMGRGWDMWTYERWGWDNWRFDSCMLRAGCY